MSSGALRIGVLAPEFPPALGGMHTLAWGLACGLAREDSVVVYTVALVDLAGGGIGSPSWLQDLAQASGGQADRPGEPGKIADALREIARSIRHTYTLGYTSTNTAPDEISEDVRDPDDKEYEHQRHEAVVRIAPHEDTGKQRRGRIS